MRKTFIALAATSAFVALLIGRSDAAPRMLAASGYSLMSPSFLDSSGIVPEYQQNVRPRPTRMRQNLITLGVHNLAIVDNDYRSVSSSTTIAT